MVCVRSSPRRPTAETFKRPSTRIFLTRSFRPQSRLRPAAALLACLASPLCFRVFHLRTGVGAAALDALSAKMLAGFRGGGADAFWWRRRS